MECLLVALIHRSKDEALEPGVPRRVKARGAHSLDLRVLDARVLGDLAAEHGAGGVDGDRARARGASFSSFFLLDSVPEERGDSEADDFVKSICLGPGASMVGASCFSTSTFVFPANPSLAPFARRFPTAALVVLDVQRELR